MTGPNRRKQWTRRSLYRMLSAFKDTDGRMTSRPTLHIFIPGQIGVTTIPHNTSHIERWGDVFNDLIAKIGYRTEPVGEFDPGYPGGLKYFDVGVWRHRFVVTCTMRNFDRERPDRLPVVADFINHIQKVTGELATVYGLSNPMNGWYTERYQKSMPVHKYLDLYRRYPEPRRTNSQ